MRWIRAMAGALVLPVVAMAQSGDARIGQPPADCGAEKLLAAIYQAEWEWWKREMAEVPDGELLAAEADHLPRVDEASQQARLAHLKKVLADVDRIDTAGLSSEDMVNAQIFRTILEQRIADLRFKTYQMPFNSDSFFWTEFTPREGFPDREGYRRYLGRLADVPRYFDENISNMRAGLARGFSVPKISVMGRDETLEPYLASDESNPLYRPFTLMPANLPADEQELLRKQARELLSTQVVAAYRKLLDFIRNEYLVKARTSIAATALRDGAAFYQANIKKFTTLELTPRRFTRSG
jgi:uncharacterized protein (DUF885 family)